MAHAPDESLVGRTLGGRYRITGVIAAGGMGAVYEGLQLGLERPVAIKVVHSFLADDTEAMSRFAREARAAGMLGHPNIVQVLDFAEATHDEPAWIALELIRGVSLTHLLRTQGPWSVERIVLLLVPVLSALEAAHRAGVIHRDLKPGNIVVSDVPGLGDVPKIVDFGVAKLREGPGFAKLTQTGAMLGTPQYMAPEQTFEGDVDARTDVYAVGCIAYALLTGAGPFAGVPIHEVLHAVRTGVPRTPGMTRKDGDRRLDDVVLRSLAKDPDKRFASAADFALALQAAAANAPASARGARTADVKALPAHAPATREIARRSPAAPVAPVPATPAYATSAVPSTRPPGMGPIAVVSPRSTAAHDAPRASQRLALAAIGGLVLAALAALVVIAALTLFGKRAAPERSAPILVPRPPVAAPLAPTVTLTPSSPAAALAAPSPPASPDGPHTERGFPSHGTLLTFAAEATRRARQMRPDAALSDIEGYGILRDGTFAELGEGTRWQFRFVSGSDVVHVEVDRDAVSTLVSPNDFHIAPIVDVEHLPDSPEIMARVVTDPHCRFEGGDSRDRISYRWDAEDRQLRLSVSICYPDHEFGNEWDATQRDGRLRVTSGCVRTRD